MEVSDGGGFDGKLPQKTPEEKPPKRKMKSPYQLEVLEKTYAVETYPSEAMRVELSAKTGLSDRQLQMWFCHRRLKDRKFPPAKKARKEEELPLSLPPPPPPSNDVVMIPGKTVGRTAPPAAAVARIGGQEMGKRYYEGVGAVAPQMMMMVPAPPPQLSMAELRVIASVEAQLGEALRDDGPVLGVEFDPLPPGAFGAPIVMTAQQKQPVRSYGGKIFDRHDAKSIKTSTFLPTTDQSFIPSSSSGKRKQSFGGAHPVHSQASSRSLHEYQFLPEQPSIRSETYERVPQSHFYDSTVVAPNPRVSPLPVGGQYLHGNDQAAPAYTFQGQMSSASILPQQGRQQIFPSGSTEYEHTPHSNSLTNTAADAQFGIHQGVGSENPYLSSDRRVFDDDDASRMDRKRKQSDEARIAKEVEAHEKKIRKELEKQDIMRRKREEQMRREMERHDRERRREEERLLREKQREEERFQREQRRESERREKFLQKETRRAEKMRQKEEMRREKEAARLKAASERATARRIAKEYMELIDDERLELMELAASSKGLSSKISLDSDTLQQLDMFRDMLSAFPPKSVQLKQPFATEPWTKSEENIGNLLMVWKFLITFTDVLGLWPFTLDEFLQSLHDYDSRLLGEIHVALLKSIIKDIEDVARTPAIMLGTNQNSAANPGGGHPQIVEGAYAWGFDIRSWQRHLNFLTWPEILRQFALSAGFGPQLKKRNVERSYFRDDNEGNDGEDVISTLRNGAAAENAVAIMHEKGYSNRRRSRHRLTPGTVKFAAFHVLSLEGDDGLTILEVADKIQKSGLRDLTTSKTPEASIAAALSRDTKLFERTAPSTYCVRPPFRKDPADADAILSTAREKIQVFQNGLSDSEEAEKDAEDPDEAEKDEDSEVDAADDPEVDDVTTRAKLSSDVLCSNELKDASASTSVDNKKGEVLVDDIRLIPRITFKNADKNFPSLPSGNSNMTSVLGVPQSLDISQGTKSADVEDTELDESNLGEPWVEGLTEGDYSDLSVEERLNALVALIGVATEGNSIRVILEERLEAANALKKQMWSEAQLDKRRFKEEYISKQQYSSFAASKAEVTQTNAAIEGSQTPPDIIDNKCNNENLVSGSNDQLFDPQCQSNTSIDKSLLVQELSANPDSIPLQQCGGYAAEKSRSQLKSYIGHKAEQLYVYRSLPLGQDRRRNRYWIFSASTSPNDPGSGRIFFESKDGLWRLIDSEEVFDALLASLDTRGIRESHLHSMLQRIEPNFKESIRRNKKRGNSASPDEFLVKTERVDTNSSPDCHTEIDSPSSTLCGLTSDTLEHSSSFRIEFGRNEMERNSALRRYQVFLKWMWKECYTPSILCAMKYGKKRCSEILQTCHFCYHSYFAEERHCSSCHKTFKSSMYNVDAIFPEHVSQCEVKRKTDPDWRDQLSDSMLPIGIQLLKAQLSVIEASIPAEALQSFWTEGYRRSWGVKLHSSSSTEDLFQLVTVLEGAIKRDCLSSNFETTSELLNSSMPGFVAERVAAISGSVSVLPWVPDTTAAVALRLLDLDASISYMLHQKLESHKEREASDFIKLPSRYTVVKNNQELEPTEFPDQADYQKEVRWLDTGSGRRGRGRGTRGRGGGRGRGRGGRGLRGLGSSSRAGFNDENVGNYEKTTRKYTRRGRTRGRGRKRGRRSVRPRQRSESRVAVAKTPFSSFNNIGISVKQDSSEESPRSSGGHAWGLEATRSAYVEPYVEDDENSVGFQSDENGQASGDEFDDQTSQYVIGYGGTKPVGLIDDDSEEDDEDDEDDGDDVGAHIGQMGMGRGMGMGMGMDMDVDVDDESEEEIGDEDGEEVGTGNGDEDEGASSFSSEYSD